MTERTEFGIVHVITDLGRGGAQTVLYSLAKVLAPDTSQTVICLTGGGRFAELLEEADIRVFCLNMRRGRFSATGFYKLHRLLRRLKPALVQTWMYHADLLGGIAARLAGIDAIVWGLHHSTLDRSGTSASTRLIVRLLGILSHTVPARIASCSNASVDVHRSIGYDEDKLIVIHNGCDTDHFISDPSARKSMRGELGLDDSETLLGMVARYNPQKDHVNLLRALKSIKERGLRFKCVLVGGGMTEENPVIEEAVRRFGLVENTILLGPRNDIDSIMNALDLHVYSCSYGEACPCVLQEAMACGTPCVTTDVGDSALIVGNQEWSVPPRHPEKLADAIVKALGEVSESGRHVLGAQCRRRIRDDFSLEAMVESYRRLWNEVLSSKRLSRQ